MYQSLMNPLQKIYLYISQNTCIVQKKYNVSIALSVGRHVHPQTEDHIGALWSYEWIP